MLVELHCHSTRSDGTDPAAEVGRRAAARDVALFCLTDHDTCAGTADAAAALPPERVLRGVEVSCTEDGKTVHVLCYDASASAGWADLEALLVISGHASRTSRRAQL